jgi:hypothetical protein
MGNHLHGRHGGYKRPAAGTLRFQLIEELRKAAVFLHRFPED